MECIDPRARSPIGPSKIVIHSYNFNLFEHDIVGHVVNFPFTNVTKYSTPGKSLTFNPDNPLLWEINQPKCPKSNNIVGYF